jgi:flagellar hook-length control protein FliK
MKGGEKMNNVSFAGQIKEGGSVDLFNAAANTKSRQSDSSGFLDLFRSHVFLGAQQEVETAQSQVFRSFSVSDSGFKTINPWERPIIKEYQKIEKPVNDGSQEKIATKSGLNEKVADETDESAIEREAKTSQIDSEKLSEARGNEPEAEDSKVELIVEAAISNEKVEEIWNTLSQTPELQQVIESLSEEQKVELTTALLDLPAEDLEIVAENPEILTGKLIEAIEALPASETKEQLLEMVCSEEFSSMIGELAEAMTAKNTAEHSLPDSEKVQLESADQSEYRLNASGKEKASKFAKTLDADGSLKNSKDESAETEGLSEENPELKASENDKDAVAEKVEKDNKQKELLKKNELAEQGSDNHSKTDNIGQESLRSEFKRLNQNNLNQNSISNTTGNEQATIKAESQNAEPGFRLDQSIISGKAANTDEVVRKIASTLMNQTSETGFKKTIFTYSPASIGNQKPTNFQNNAGNGFSNGFSQSQAHSAQPVSRQVPNVNNSVFLSQLLEKAEMFKTSDGKKVLSLEMDPKELGKMEMELTSKDGTVTAKISAESELAKVRLEELAPQIKEHLNTQGINLTEITVDISSGHPDERNNQNLSERKNKSGRTEKVGLDNSEQVIRRNILPNLRKVALNIQSVDLTV